MDDIVKRERMTSLEIAEITGKRHSDIMRAIRNMEDAWENVCGCKFALTSQIIDMPNGGTRNEPCFSLSKRECLYIATKFNDEARAKLIIRWEELEKQHQAAFPIPQTYADALLLAANQAKQIEEQQKTIKANAEEIVALSSAITEMKPKVSYYDQILASKSTVTVTQIAQDYGMSAKAFNVLLRNFGIQHKVNGQWILYAEHLKRGYVHSKSVDIIRRDGSHDTKLNTEWLQSGRLFLYEALKKHDILPLIER